jgi:hypothetical protein
MSSSLGAIPSVNQRRYGRPSGSQDECLSASIQLGTSCLRFRTSVKLAPAENPNPRVNILLGIVAVSCRALLEPVAASRAAGTAAGWVRTGFSPQTSVIVRDRELSAPGLIVENEWGSSNLGKAIVLMNQNS